MQELWEKVRFSDSCKKILITHLLRKACENVSSQPDSIERYFTEVGCVMSTSGEDDHLIFPQKFSSGDYFFVYAADDNNVVVLIQATLESEDKLEDEILGEDVVYTMLDDILD